MRPAPILPGPSGRECFENISGIASDDQGDNAGEQNNGKFEPSTDLKQNAVQRIPQRLRAHGHSEDHSDHLADEIFRRLCLDKGQHLDRKYR